MFCTKCGHENEEDVKFCTNCGKSISEEENSVIINNPKPKIALIKIIGVIVLVASALFVYWLFNLGSDSTFKSDYKTTFVESCIQAGGVDFVTYCTCNADYLINNYTVKELTDISERYSSTNKTTREIRNAGATCMTENLYGKKFIDKCTSGGGSMDACTCVLGYLINNATLASRVEMDYDYDETQQSPPILDDAVNSCVK